MNDRSDDDQPTADLGDQADEQPAPVESRRLNHRVEIVEVLLIALAAILTAWSAFQSTKWGGVQANSYASASALRTESVRASTRAGQMTAIDVDTFTSFVAALGAEERTGVENGLEPDGTYSPVEGTESAFLFARFRPEFKTAVDAWLETEPLANPDSPATPFAMPEYQVAEAQTAIDLEQQADGLSARARQANQRGDNYVMLTIVFAFVVVIVGIGSKMESFGARAFLVGIGATALVAGMIVLLTFPVEV